MRLFLLICLICLSAGRVIADDFSLSREWLKLLHYQGNNGKFLSLVENQEFFMSADGRYNPQGEYTAAITAFNNPSDRRKCDFPARFLLLERKGIVKGTLGDCEDYQKFLHDVQPKAVTMLFTNAYMSNPSSLFGHTLFRIDTKRKGTQLLAHGVNFGADTGDESGVIYALKGLWGGYYGTFGIKPYYDVINLYNNIENRDIWEYPLNLSEDELALFTAHMWEMKQAKIRYYYLNKNCSYVLLTTLEAVKPELDLTSDFKWNAIPLSTLKAVDEVPELVKGAVYRPSRLSKLKYRAKQMNEQQRVAFKEYLQNGKMFFDELNDDEKADVLETAYQYVQYRYVEGTVELEEYRRQSLNLLRMRSKIVNKRQYFDELKEGENPVLAHKAGQVGVMFGARNGDIFQEVSIKPAYTSLTDDSFGLLRGAEINMMATKFRYYDEQNKLLLDEFNLLNIKSLASSDIMFSPLSYEIDAAIRRIFDAKKGGDYAALVVKTGAGQSYEVAENMLFYIITSPNMAYSGGISDNGYLGLAFKGGIYYNSNPFRVNIFVEQNFTTADISSGQTYAVELGYGLTRNVMFYAGYKFFNSEYHDDEEMNFGVKVNF